MRTSIGEIVQFNFGEDGLDPCFMEAKTGNVVDYDHILFHIRSIVPFDFEDGGKQLGVLSELLEFMKGKVETQLRKRHSLFTDQTLAFLTDYLTKNQKYIDMPTHCSSHQRAS